MLKAQLAFKGERLWSKELDRFNGGEFVGYCPNCGVELYLVIGEYGFFTASESNWNTESSLDRTAIVPNSGTLPLTGQWMINEAERARQSELISWIKHLFGTGTCLICRTEFDACHAIAATQ